MIRTWALFAVLISGALIDVARGGDLVECEPQRVTGDGHYWAYRIIDGRECWYPGRPGKPKNELYWVRGTTSFRAPDGAPARDRDRALRVALPPRGCAAGETGDRRGNAGRMARDRRRPVARVHLLLAGVGGGRPAPTADAQRRRAAGLAAGPATARALPAVVDCQAKTRITGCSCQRCWSSSRAQPSASPQCPR